MKLNNKARCARDKDVTDKITGVRCEEMIDVKNRRECLAN